MRADLLGRWKRQLEAAGEQPLSAVFPGQGKLASEEEEVRRLRREVETLRQERDFGRKAAAYFARESP